MDAGVKLAPLFPLTWVASLLHCGNIAPSSLTPTPSHSFVNFPLQGSPSFSQFPIPRPKTVFTQSPETRWLITDPLNKDVSINGEKTKLTCIPRCPEALLGNVKGEYSCSLSPDKSGTRVRTKCFRTKFDHFLSSGRMFGSLRNKPMFDTILMLDTCGTPCIQPSHSHPPCFSFSFFFFFFFQPTMQASSVLPS